MVTFKPISVLVVMLFLFLAEKVQCNVEFTNINCTSLDPDFMEFDQCFLKSLNRTYKYLTVKAKFYKFPINDMKIHIEVLKRLNGYKPFLYNFSTDACKFLGGKQNMLHKFFYNIVSPYTNIVHKCPYNHDVFVANLPISHVNHIVTNVLPVPDGEYCLHSVYTADEKIRADIRVNGRIY